MNSKQRYIKLIEDEILGLDQVMADTDGALEAISAIGKAKVIVENFEHENNCSLPSVLISVDKRDFEYILKNEVFDQNYFDGKLNELRKSLQKIQNNISAIPLDQ